MKSRHILTMTLFASLAACSSPPPKAEFAPPSPEAKIVAQKEKASYVIEVSFDKGSSNLNPSAMDRIDETLQRARHDGALEKVKVIAWADTEYPSTAKKQLSKKQRNLAEARAKSIDDYISPQTQATVEKYNMAERPNAMEELVATSDARIKRSLEDAGIATTAHDLRHPENASKAMVMVILKE